MVYTVYIYTLNIGEDDDKRWDRPMKFYDAETVVDWLQ